MARMPYGYNTRVGNVRGDTFVRSSMETKQLPDLRAAPAAAFAIKMNQHPVPLCLGVRVLPALKQVCSATNSTCPKHCMPQQQSRVTWSVSSSMRACICSNMFFWRALNRRCASLFFSFSFSWRLRLAAAPPVPNSPSRSPLSPKTELS